MFSPPNSNTNKLRNVRQYRHSTKVCHRSKCYAMVFFFHTTLSLVDVHELAKPAQQLVKHEVQLVDKIAEASEQWLKNRGERFVRANADSAILEMFMSDCTPSTSLENLKAAWDEFFVMRRARSSKEYLGQRLFLCTLGSICLVVGSFWFLFVLRPKFALIYSLGWTLIHLYFVNQLQISEAFRASGFLMTSSHSDT